ncbi:MAG: hypothetical protein JRD00_00490 [Deltaproteobacteria bacterium]|nr:hypothetical protein [Deltaproteobacteria bacterium]
MIITDHLTPIRTRTHARGFVPFAVCDLPASASETQRGFSERSAAKTGVVVRPGYKLMEKFVKGELVN